MFPRLTVPLLSLAAAGLLALQPPGPAPAGRALAQAPPSPPPAAQPQAADPFAAFTRGWRDDPVWYDGQAEIAVYDATRTIYGQPRTYRARVMTNKELASPLTKTKAADHDPQANREVFKHHLREDIPAGKYDYHFSTMAYVGTADLKSLKLDMGVQEDCGATFKQYVNHAGQLEWHQLSYFPGEGHRRGSYRPPAHFAFEDALGVVLRGYPFEQPPPTLELKLLTSQRSNRLTPAEPPASGVAIVQYRGREELELPIGRVEAHHLVLWLAPDADGHYWFAADGRPPWLHVLVQYRGAQGATYQLRELRREAYWEQ